MERFAGRYLLTRQLGRGGMGAVFLAHDLAAASECALKRLDPGMLRVAPDSLRTEFEILTRVRHPSIVAVHELGIAPDGTPFYTMEYVAGVHADQAVTPGDWRTLCLLAAQIAAGLEVLHGSGILHGDVKPSNVLVVQGAQPGAPPAGVRLVDFGLAALLDRDRERHRGTHGFAAPEIVAGEEPSIVSDLYGLGATLFAMAVRAPAAVKPSTRSGIKRGQRPTRSLHHLKDAGIAPAVAQLIMRLLAVSPSERPDNAREVRREFERLHPPARRDLAARLQTEILAGRERDLGRLERLSLTDSPSPRMTLLAGEAGTGKSAVLGQIAVRATLNHRRAYRLSCAASEAPGHVVRSLLQRLAIDANAATEEGLVSRQVLTLIESAAPAPDEPEMSLMAEAAAEWAKLIRGKGPPLLVLLDDWERVDPVSRAALIRAALHPESMALRWVCAARAEAFERAPADRLLLEAGQAHAYDLGGLDRSGAERLIAARLSDNPPVELTGVLWERVGGHPGLIVESLRAIAAAGALRESDAGLTLDASRLALAAAPTSFEAALLDRYAGLSAALRKAAIALAVWGRPATCAEVRLIEPNAGDDDVRRLVASGLVQRSAEDVLAFVPPTLAARILEPLEVSARRKLHLLALKHTGLSPHEKFQHLRGAGKVLDALAAAQEGSGGDRLVLDAAALAEAAAPEQAPEWQQRAGTALIERGRFREAIPYLQQSLAADLKSPSRPERWHLLTRALTRAGRPAELGVVIGQALAEDPPAPQYWRLLVSKAGWLGASNLPDDGVAVGREALRQAETGDDHEYVAYSAMILADLLRRLGQFAESRAMANRAVETSERLGDRLAWVRSLEARASVARHEQDWIGAERLFEQALSVARREGLGYPTEALLHNFGGFLVEIGRWKEGREAHAEAERLALEGVRMRGVALALSNLAQTDGLMGNAARALRQSRAALRVARAHMPLFEAIALRSLAQAHRISGRLLRAERVARVALQRAVDSHYQFEMDWAGIEYGRVCAARNHWAEAEGVWLRCLAGSPQGYTVGGTVLAALAGRAALRRSDVDAAKARLADSISRSRDSGAPYAGAHVLQLRAEIAFHEGRTGEAMDLARAVLEAYKLLPAPADRANAALEFARLIDASGEESPAPVDEWLQDAAETFGRLGDHRLREHALALGNEWLRRHRGAGRGISRDRGLIQSVSRLLNSLSDLTELTQRAMQMAVEHLSAERGVLLLIDPNSGHLVSVVEHGALDGSSRDRAMTFSRRAVERVVEAGHWVLIDDATKQPEAISESVVDLGLRSIVCVPLFVGGRVVGAVYLDDSRRPDTFSADDRALLEGFAHLIAIAVEKSRGQEEITRTNDMLAGENASLRREVGMRFQPRNFIGRSFAMQQVLAVVERAAHLSTTVLLTGENGTGKEMIARILHNAGKRRLGAFVPVNCGAIPETLIESELFGILPNVATGVRARDGRFVQAHGGTLFLDEIGDMPLKQQVALLNAISSREITPVGGGKQIPVDVRIIAATNHDLRRRVEDGLFREDLFYRLNVVPVEIPALRERKADIPALAQYFTAHFAQQQERETPSLSAEFLAALMQSDWPGNVRELQNYIERIMAMTSGPLLQPKPLPRDLEARAPRMSLGRSKKLTDMLGNMERRLIREALERGGGNQSRAARELGLTEQSLRYRLRRYSIAQTRKNQRIRRKRR